MLVPGAVELQVVCVAVGLQLGRSWLVNNGQVEANEAVGSPNMTAGKDVYSRNVI